MVSPQHMIAAEKSGLGDPLLCDFEMPLRAVFHPLGFSVEITTNSRELLLAAEESWGVFHKMFPDPPIQLRMGVLDGGSNGAQPIPVCRSQQNLVSSVVDENNFWMSDLEQGFGFGWFTRATVESRAYFRYHFLESAALILLMSRYMTAIHAACVAWDGRGVLLCGDSGAGKSSLAFACARRGWTYIADDTSALVRSRSDRIVVGNPHRIRFRESATDLFPDLSQYPLTRRITGEMAIELATRDLSEIVTAPQAPVDYVVFLNRQEECPATLLPASPEKALRHFEGVICYGESSTRKAQKTSLRNLLTAGLFELLYSDLDSAISRLEILCRERG